MRLGIELNGVLRNTIDKVEKVYTKYLIEKTEGVEDISNFQYEIVYPITSLDLKKHFKFPTEDDLFSFLYDEFSMEIFGHAQSAEYSTFIDFNEFYTNFRDNFEILIVSDEIGKSKPASLFFLAKFGCLVEKVKFYNNFTINSMWNEVDILLTSNPALLLNYPKNKEVIKYSTFYNEDINAKFSISSFKELESELKKIMK